LHHATGVHSSFACLDAGNLALPEFMGLDQFLREILIKSNYFKLVKTAAIFRRLILIDLISPSLEKG
jgi:hypothetical protein